MKLGDFFENYNIVQAHGTHFLMHKETRLKAGARQHSRNNSVKVVM